MKILGIETSCDETAVAVIEMQNSSPKVLSSVVSSQIELHAQFGGVVPNLAAREHVKNIGVVFDAALNEAKATIEDIDLIAVTQGPGLIPALTVGTAFSKTLSFLTDKPIVGVNHMIGHIYANWLSNEKIDFPLLNLIVSGGHTMLVLMKNHYEFELIGETLDDAAGEAFDKVARILELSYPGGPEISKQAQNYDGKLKIDLPRPMLNSQNFDFSFSGLKTAVLYRVNDLKEKYSLEDIRPAVAHEFQNAVIEVLVKKTIKAAKEHGIQTVMLSGGVAANKLLREELKKKCDENGLVCHLPDLKYTTDNAAMIAIAGYFKNKKIKKPDWKSVQADANLMLASSQKL
jgi:N6-L-threonylcarbamoyladenine synthase